MARSKPAGYMSPSSVALYGVLTALTAAVTYASYTPFSPTKGYFNLGDAMVFFSALTFGIRAGGICGGVGSAAADILLGSGIFAPLTLVAKGSEGAVCGLVYRIGGRRQWAMIAGVAAGGTCMIVSYFLGEWLVLGMGLAKAAAEIPINIGQVVIGGAIGGLLAYYIRKSYKSPLIEA